MPLPGIFEMVFPFVACQCRARKVDKDLRRRRDNACKLVLSCAGFVDILELGVLSKILTSIEGYRTTVRNVLEIVLLLVAQFKQ